MKQGNRITEGGAGGAKLKAGRSSPGKGVQEKKAKFHGSLDGGSLRGECCSASTWSSGLKIGGDRGEATNCGRKTHPQVRGGGGKTHEKCATPEEKKRRKTGS